MYNKLNENKTIQDYIMIDIFENGVFIGSVEYCSNLDEPLEDMPFGVKVDGQHFGLTTLSNKYILIVSDIDDSIYSEVVSSEHALKSILIHDRLELLEESQFVELKSLYNQLLSTEDINEFLKNINLNGLEPSYDNLTFNGSYLPPFTGHKGLTIDSTGNYIILYLNIVKECFSGKILSPTEALEQILISINKDYLLNNSDFAELKNFYSNQIN